MTPGYAVFTRNGDWSNFIYEATWRVSPIAGNQNALEAAATLNEAMLNALFFADLVKEPNVLVHVPHEADGQKPCADYAQAMLSAVCEYAQYHPLLERKPVTFFFEKEVSPMEDVVAFVKVLKSGRFNFAGRKTLERHSVRVCHPNDSTLSL